VKELLEKKGTPSDVAEEMVSFMSFRITEENGVLTTLDSFGNGFERSISFSLGQEFENEGSEFTKAGTSLITETSPGKWTYVQTDVDGKTEVWTGEFTEDSMVWRSPKDQVEITYSRYGDPTGTWKAVYLDSTEMLRFYGMDDALIQKIESESYTMDVQHVGKGVWEWESHSKAMPQPKMAFKFGEEFEIDWQGMAIKETCLHTKTGMSCDALMGGVKSSYNLSFGQTFLVQTGTIEGSPLTSTAIYVRV